MNTNQQTLDNLVHKNLNDHELAQVQKLLRVDSELWKEYGDINNWTRQKALEVIEDGTVEFACVVKGLKELRKSLLAEGNSPLETIAIEQIITNHLQVARSGFELEGLTACKELAAVSNHWIRVHNHAHARLVRSINTLTKLRKINLNTIILKDKHRHIKFEEKLAEIQADIKQKCDLIDQLEAEQENKAKQSANPEEITTSRTEEQNRRVDPLKREPERTEKAETKRRAHPSKRTQNEPRNNSLKKS